MNAKDFAKSLKTKNVKALLELQKDGFSEESNISPDFLNLIIEELNSRELNEKEKVMFERLMNSSFEDVVSEGQTKAKRNSSDKKYGTLKRITSWLSFFGVITLIAGFALSIQLTSFYGFLSLITSVITALLLLAFSKLIQVLIDIENNTRKTAELLEKTC